MRSRYGLHVGQEKMHFPQRVMRPKMLSLRGPRVQLFGYGLNHLLPRDPGGDLARTCHHCFASARSLIVSSACSSLPPMVIESLTT